MELRRNESARCFCFKLKICCRNVCFHLCCLVHRMYTQDESIRYSAEALMDDRSWFSSMRQSKPRNSPPMCK